MLEHSLDVRHFSLLSLAAKVLAKSHADLHTTVYVIHLNLTRIILPLSHRLVAQVLLLH